MIRIIKEKSGKCIQNVFLETPFLKGFGSNTEEMWVVSFHPAQSFSRSLGLSLMISSQLLGQCSSEDTRCDGDKPSFRECWRSWRIPKEGEEPCSGKGRQKRGVSGPDRQEHQNWLTADDLHIKSRGWEAHCRCLVVRLRVCGRAPRQY